MDNTLGHHGFAPLRVMDRPPASQPAFAASRPVPGNCAKRGPGTARGMRTTRRAARSDSPSVMRGRGSAG